MNSKNILRIGLFFYLISLPLAAQSVTGVNAGTGRLGGSLAALTSLISILIGGWIMAQTKRQKRIWRSSIFLSIGLGICGIFLSALHLIRATGEIGTGSGRLGALVGLVLGIIGLVLGLFVLARARRIYKATNNTSSIGN